MKSGRVSNRGRVTIPQEIRTGMGLKKGDRVEFVFEDGKTVLRPARTRHNSFDKYLGAFPYFKTIDEINAWVREMREDRADRD